MSAENYPARCEHAAEGRRGLGAGFGKVVQRSRPVLSQRLCGQKVGSPELTQERMIAAAIGRLGRVEEGRRFGSVAKLTMLDFEETDAGKRVEEPRQTIGLDFERDPKAKGQSSRCHRAG
ncbi:hypothetical protein [Mesorhizobium sp.]|uniref:hypothetical protein n=1 Tax=Mesorhizobium sp. TaxID=1871066 RepID=UPI00257E9060|nr:hypothetical protein [Mesorhizobium sp.]